jgi:hypothetical protein
METAANVEAGSSMSRSASKSRREETRNRIAEPPLLSGLLAENRSHRQNRLGDLMRVQCERAEIWVPLGHAIDRVVSNVGIAMA